MPKYRVTVTREETWTAETEVDAESAEQAIEKINNILDTGSWDDVFPNDPDGDYCECINSATSAEPVDDNRAAEATRA